MSGAGVDQRDRLDPGTAAEVLALATAAGDADGTYPLAEDVVIHLHEDGDPPGVHLLARDPGGRLAGYAYLDLDPEAAGELVVHPRSRRHGLGRRLATAALAVAWARPGAGGLRLWSHGDHPGAAALAGALGFTRARVLHQLRRPLTDPVPAPVLPAGVSLRPFRPGADDAAWLAVNARAFADHPEQGRWGAADLRLRLAQPWFDPAGFLLAVRGEELLGFHWTKIHSEADPPLGEVYVLGVDPAAHGLGLGTALTLAGLRHLRGRGLAQAMLYVEESNPAALGLYRKLGFAGWSTDVAYALIRTP